MTFVIKQNDTYPYLDELLFDGNKCLVDPSTFAQVKFNAAIGNLNIADHLATAIVAITIDAAMAATLNGQGYRLSDGTAFVSGTYNAVEYRWEDIGITNKSSPQDGVTYEWETTDSSGRILTFPNGTNNTLTIAPQVK